MLIDEIKKASMLALKNKESAKRTAYSVAVSKFGLIEVEKRAKGEQPTDADVIQILQKLIKELKEEKEMYIGGGKTDRAISAEEQIQAISVFLPKMLSQNEICEIIASLDDKSMKSVMMFFKENFAGKVDMSLVSKVLRS